MRAEYDFTKARKNPYARRLKKQITIRIDEPTLEYFQELAEENGLPYQTLINLYLRDCASKGKRLALSFTPAKTRDEARGDVAANKARPQSSR